MFYYLYEIKNLINGKVYRGVHKTKKMDDGYMGSGAAICEAVKADGIENFTKTILETFECSESMFRREEELVDAEFLSRDDVYNKRRGGLGGFDYINDNAIPKFKGKVHTVDSKKKISKALAGRTHTDETKSKMVKNNWARTDPAAQKAHASLIAKTRRRNIKTEEEKNIISSLIKDKWATGSYTNRKSNNTPKNKNKIWITDGVKSKMMNSSCPVPEGWRLGRKFATLADVVIAAA